MNKNYKEGDMRGMKEFFHLSPNAKLKEIQIHPDKNFGSELGLGCVTVLVEDNKGKDLLMVLRMPKGYNMRNEKDWDNILKLQSEKG